MLSLLLRNLLFTILQPGVVTVLIPYLILSWQGKTLFPERWTVLNVVGAILMIVGASILLSCVLKFATEGKGTISPLDPTKKLVAKGLYRYSRNPMYLGAMTLLIGEAVFWQAISLAIYAVIVFIGFNLFVIFHEEPRCRRDFGDAYCEYCERVRRWL